MKLTEVSIRRHVFAWMLMAALILFGAFSFRGMGISQLPDVDFPVIAISLSYPGAAPEVMESSVVDPIEDAVMGIQGVSRVTSSSSQGAATITVEFDLGRNIDLAQTDVQAKVEQARRFLPTDLDPPTITKTNPEDQPILWLALTAPGRSDYELARYVRDVLKGEFATIPGVGDIRLGGYLEPNLRVWVDPKKLVPLQLTLSDVANAIRAGHYEPPSGYIDAGPKELNVRMLGEADTPRDFAQLSINQRGGQPNFRPVPLGRVARVENGTEDVRRLARSDGVPAIGLGIQKQRGANAVAVARAVRARLPEVQKSLPRGMKLEIHNDSTRFIEDAVHELNFTLLLSALLTAVVCWAFLGSWSATLNVLLAIPTSIVGAFTALYFLGFTLNTFTLLALSLSIGIVVDDAIMVLENIVRRREEGDDRVAAALFGTREISFAAIAATVSILAIFLPVAFMKGIIGRFFFQFGMALSVAVLLSLLEALTLTPMRTSRFLKVGERTTRIGRGIEAAFDALRRGYSRTLASALRHRLLVIAASLIAFAASLLVLRGLNREFLPAEDQGQFIVRVTTPLGSSLDFTSERMARIERGLLARPEVAGVFAVAGGFGGGQANSGFAFVNLKPGDQREKSQQQLMTEVRQQLNRIPGVRAITQDLSARGFSTSRGFPIEFTVQGPDWQKLVGYTERIMREMERSGMATDVDMDYEGQTRELAIVPDRARARARGVSVADIGDTVATAIGGLRVAKFTSDGRRYDVRLKRTDPPDAAVLRDPANALQGLLVRNNRGETLPVTDVVRIERRPAPVNLTRLNRQRAITVFANVAPGKSQQAALQRALEIGRQALPDGYAVAVSGTAQTFQESISSLLLAMILGLAIAYMVLATQFNSFADPITVLMALPFSVSGAFLALLITGQSINIYSMIGLILLMGIVKKNSILLIDFTNQVRSRRGVPVREALLEACPLRLRPIIMTSIATVAGAMPAAVALGPGAESRRPMAIAVIGGVLLSTLLTLYVVPCIATILSRGRHETVPEVDRLLRQERQRELEKAS
jgi:HAE1 family hydrophobic/amphiphilic exporter-1